MPRSRPPKTTRNGTRHPRATTGPAAPPDLPLGPLDVPRRTRAAGPLAHLEVPIPDGASPVVAVVRRLDAGRLFAPRLAEAAGWEENCPLVADLTATPWVSLTRRRGLWGAESGTTRPHVTADGRIVVPTGLRAFLGVGPCDEVLAWTPGGGVVHLASPDVLAHVMVRAVRAAPGGATGAEGDGTVLPLHAQRERGG